jgi:hypothetical protein
MEPDETRAEYLATGSGDPPEPEQLDLIRRVLGRTESWDEPPAEVMEGLLSTVGRESGASAARDAPTRSRRAWMAGVAALVAVLAMGAIVAAVQQPAGTVVAMTGTELAPQAAGRAVVEPVSTGWKISLDLTGLEAAPEGSYYEGWVWSDDGEGVSIGTFHLRGEGEQVILWSGVPPGSYPWIWVTLQGEGDGPAVSDLVMLKGRAEPAAG